MRTVASRISPGLGGWVPPRALARASSSNVARSRNPRPPSPRDRLAEDEEKEDNPFLTPDAKARLETLPTRPKPEKIERFQGEKPERRTKWIIEDTKKESSALKTPSTAPSSPEFTGEVCKGCGAKIQTSEPKRLGFVPAEKLFGPQIPIPDDLENEALRSILAYKPPAPTDVHVKCQRCWKLEHYGVVVPVEVRAEELLNELKHIKNKKSLVVKIVDVFDFDGTFIESFSRFSGGNPVILLVNKIDLLPADVSLERVEKWVRTEAKHRGLDPAAVFLVSAFTGLNLKRVAEAIHELRKDRDVFIMGLSNVGKSSIVNRLWPILSPDAVKKRENKVTVSKVPGTTVATVGLPFSDGFSFYDTPGIMPEDGLNNAIPLSDYLSVLPKKRIAPKLHHLRAGHSLFIGGFARIDLLKGASYINLLVYMSPEIDIRQCLTEEADELFEKNIYDPILSPFKNREISLSAKSIKRPRLVPGHPREYDCKSGYNRATVDIVFAGLGWVAVAAKDRILLKTWYLPKCNVSERPPLMPFEVVRKKV